MSLAHPRVFGPKQASAEASAAGPNSAKARKLSGLPPFEARRQGAVQFGADGDGAGPAVMALEESGRKGDAGANLAVVPDMTDAEGDDFGNAKTQE